MGSYYSVIQYQPDAGRCEAVNVGLIIFREEPYLLHVQMADNDDRVRRFFPKVNLQAIKWMKDAMQHALTHPSESLKNPQDAPWTLERLSKEMARRSMNTMNCVPFRACVLGDNPAERINEFYKQLVLEPE